MWTFCVICPWPSWAPLKNVQYRTGYQQTESCEQEPDISHVITVCSHQALLCPLQPSQMRSSCILSHVHVSVRMSADGAYLCAAVWRIHNTVMCVLHSQRVRKALPWLEPSRENYWMHNEWDPSLTRPSHQLLPNFGYTRESRSNWTSFDVVHVC